MPSIPTARASFGGNEIDTDTVVRFDPRSEHMRVIELPGSTTGIRKMAVDARGRL